jgi:uncharacterized ParB-like nuclease family protein
MIFDTGSNWLWIDSRICSNCPENLSKFDERSSNTFKYYKSVKSLYYGTGSVHGYNAYDKVCITTELCADEYSFLIVLK